MELKRVIHTEHHTASIAMQAGTDGYYLKILKDQQCYFIRFRDARSCALCYEIADEDLINDLKFSFNQHEGILKFSVHLN